MLQIKLFVISGVDYFNYLFWGFTDCTIQTLQSMTDVTNQIICRILSYVKK